MNLWLDMIMRWGQDAIDGRPIRVDSAGSRQQLFVAVLESLAAKEAPPGLTIEPFAGHRNPLIGVPLSGGLDSLVAYEMAREARFDVRPFYVKLNTPYVEAEMAAIKKIGIDVTLIDLGDWPRRWKPYQTEWQHILPLRNLAIIAAIAEKLDDEPGEIWLGATEGEIPIKGGDKSVRFFDAADTVLDTFPIKHTLRFPLKNLTKTDLVRWWIQKDKPIEQLTATITCQSPQAGRACGTCHACFNRWVAMSNNGIDEQMVFEPHTVQKNAEKVAAMQQALNDHEFGTWSERRIIQTLQAWARAVKSTETTV